MPLLPAGTITVIVLSSTWVNLAAPPGPKDTMLTHPGSPKFSPAIVTLSPVLPSSGVTFLILGVAPEQLRPLVSRGDSEALALLLWIPPPGPPWPSPSWTPQPQLPDRPGRRRRMPLGCREYEPFR